MTPIGFAHRGARAERPENTLAAFAKALELGSTGLESDAWITADGVAVLVHRGVVGPLWRRRRIGEVERSDLPRHIPALGELFSSCGTDYELSLDVKDPAALAPILSAARSFGAERRLWLCHPDLPTLRAWRPDVPSSRLVNSTRLTVVSHYRRLPAGGSRLDSANMLVGTGLAVYLEEAQAVGLDAVNLRSKEWDRAAVDQVHSADLLAFGWGAHRRPEIDRVLDIGLDGIYCDHPAVAMEAIRERYRGSVAAADRVDPEGAEGLQGAYPTEGPDDEEGSPDDEPLRYRPDHP